MTDTPRRKVVIRTYVHFEGEEAPGYYVDNEMTEVFTERDIAASRTRWLPHFVGLKARWQAHRLMEQMLDPNDPSYGQKKES